MCGRGFGRGNGRGLVGCDGISHHIPIAFSFPEILHAIHVSTSTVLIQSLMHLSECSKRNGEPVMPEIVSIASAETHENSTPILSLKPLADHTISRGIVVLLEVETSNLPFTDQEVFSSVYVDGDPSPMHCGTVRSGTVQPLHQW